MFVLLLLCFSIIVTVIESRIVITDVDMVVGIVVIMIASLIGVTVDIVVIMLC